MVVPARAGSLITKMTEGDYVEPGSLGLVGTRFAMKLWTVVWALALQLSSRSVARGRAWRLWTNPVVR